MQTRYLNYGCRLMYKFFLENEKLHTSEPYPTNEIPEDLIGKIGEYFVYLLYIGRKDIAGSDWRDAFSSALGGVHLNSPVGIADVVLGKMA